MRDLIANTWPEFLNIVRNEKIELGSHDNTWYRGQSRTNYKLIPSLLRYPQGLNKEKVLFSEYTKSAETLNMKREDDWLYLVDMQHYGIPTRLLDWTTVLGVAIAFAMYDGNDDEDSAIYLLNPVKLNKESGIDYVRRVPENTSSYDYQNMYFKGIPLKPRKPIAIDCNFANARVAAQNGTFTVHGTEVSPFDDDEIIYGSKIILKASAKIGAREFLEHANLNAFSIYPDIAGMARYLRNKHGL